MGEWGHYAYITLHELTTGLFTLDIDHSTIA